jgi:hypothetical protein
VNIPFRCIGSLGTQDFVLGKIQPSPSGLDRLSKATQDFILCYFQPSLRDWYRHNPDGGLVFGKCCPNEPLEKANLDKSEFQPSLRD